MELHAKIIHFVNKKEVLSGCSGHLNATFCTAAPQWKSREIKRRRKREDVSLILTWEQPLSLHPTLPSDTNPPPPGSSREEAAASSGTWHRYYKGSGRAWCLVELRRLPAENDSSEHGCVADTLCKVRKSFSSQEFVASQLITTLLTVCATSFFSALLFYIFGDHLHKLLSHRRITNNEC